MPTLLNRRLAGSWTRGLTLGLLVGGLTACASAPGAPRRGADVDRRPNVVVLVADDLRADTLGSAGHAFAVTPNIDRLAHEGVRFSEAFSTAGTCAPARASLLTGKHVARHGLSHIMGHWHTFDRQETTLPAQLDDHGYRTIHVGKWHLGNGHLPHPGYDRWIGTPFLRYSGSRWWIDGEETTRTDLPDHCDLAIATLAAEEIRTATRGRRRGSMPPFALYVGFKSPHRPFTGLPAYDDFLADVDLPVPADIAASADGQGLSRLARRELAEFGGSWQALAKAYLRSVRTLDHAVGIVLDALDQADASRDTLVVLTSDQGLALGEHGLIGKGFGWDQTMRIPLVMRFPARIAGGAVIHELTQLTDIVPTVRDYLDLPPADAIDGRSLRPLIEGTATSWRDDAFFEYWYYRGRGQRPAHVALRTDRHKLIQVRDEPPRIFDLVADPEEQHDRADDPAYADVLDDLTQRLARHQATLDWRPRRQYPVAWAAALLVPSQAHARQVAERYRHAPPYPGQTTTIGHRERRWRAMPLRRDGRLRFGKLPDATPGMRVLFAIPIERTSERDPAIVVRPHRNNPPLVGLVDGREAWSFEPAEDQPLWIDAGFNPPLGPGRDTIWIVATVPEEEPSVRLQVIAPEGTVVLPNKDGQW